MGRFSEIGITGVFISLFTLSLGIDPDQRGRTQGHVDLCSNCVLLFAPDEMQINIFCHCTLKASHKK